MAPISRRSLVIAAVAIWLAAFAAFSNSFTIAFQFDDMHTVQSNVFVRSLANVPRYFIDANTYSYRPENSGYRPMSTLGCALGFQLSQNETWGFHLVKLIEHCLLATLILLTSLRLLPRRGLVADLGWGRFAVAFFGALVFAVHRANTETVDYITAISSLQAGLFLVLGFYLYLRFTEVSPDEGWKRYGWIALSSLSYFASMLSKEEGITLPAMIALHAWLYAPSSTKRSLADWLKLLAPYVAIAALYVTLRTLIQSAVADTSRGNVPRFDYAITQLRSWLYYWKLFFWPVTLNADNLSFDFSRELSDWRVLVAGLAHGTVFAAAWKFGRHRPYVLFSVAWAYVTVLPASSVFPLVEAVNEHRMYIQYALIAPFVVWLVLSAAVRLNRPKLGVAVLAAWSIALGVGAYARNEVWQTPITLWQDVFDKNPESPRAMNVLGVSLVNEGEYARALPLLEKCRLVAPRYLPCMVHLSMAYAQARRYDDGLKLLQYAVSLDANYPHTNFHLGLYFKEYFGKFDEALRFLTHVTRITQGRFYQSTLKSAEIYIEQARYDEAIAAANSVLDLDITSGDAWEVQGRARMLKGDVAGARRVLERLVEAAPDVAKYQLDYAHLNERERRFDLALGAYRAAVRATPASIQGWAGLARVARLTGNPSVSFEAQAKVDELKRSDRWTFYHSMMFPGEKVGQRDF